MRLSKLESLAGEPDLDPCRCVIELYFLSLSHPFRSHARDEPLSSGFQASVSTPSGTSVSFNKEKHATTIRIPVLISASYIFCILLSEGKERLYHEGVEDG